MAAQMLSPGVKVTIMDFTDYVSEASSTCIGIVGGARKGPTGATLIKSREQALLTFGEPSPKDFGIYSLLAVLENSTKVYYNRIISQDTKATAGNELKHKVLFQTKNYTSEYNGVRIKILKPDWNDEWLTGSLDPEHPEEFVGSDENIAKYGVDLSEVAQDTDETRRKQYFDIELSTTTGVLEEIKFCHLDTVVDRVAEESGIVEAFVNPDSSLSILYNTAMKLDGGSEFGASIAETEEHEGLKFFTKTYDSTVEGWYVEFSEETFMGTIDYTLYDVHGNVIEYFPDLVAFPNDDKYIETYINLNSDYVQCTLDSSLDDSNTVTRFQNLTFRFSGGLDGLDNINESDVVKALEAYSNPEIIEVDVIIAPGWSSTAVIDKGIEICEGRQECMYIIDPPFGLSPQQVVDWSNAQGEYRSTGSNASEFFNTSYAAIYLPWVQVYDEFTKSYIWMPPSGYVAGQMAYSDEQSENWFAPAGINRGVLTSVVGLEMSPSQAERDLLYGRSNCINPIINFQQLGVVIWGQKTTLRGSSALTRVNVRRLVNYLKKIITASTYYFVFDPNDAQLWQKWSSLIDTKLANIKSRRGIYEYKVIMDGTTVSARDIEEYRMPGIVKFKPTRSAEFIPLDFMIMPYAASFA